MALQSKTITGSTNNSNWTHKIVVTENSTNVSANTSSVTVTAYIGRSSTSSYMYGASISDKISVTSTSAQTISYSNSGTVTIAGGGWLNIGSKTFTVPHNSDGSKSITISSSFSNNVSPSSGSASGIMTLTKIPRYATTTNATNFNDENNPTITFSNPGNLSLRPYLNFYLNETYIKRIERNIGSYSSPYTWNLTDTERAELRSLLANYNSCQVNIGVDTYSGSTAIGYSSLSKTFSIVNADPIFTDFDFEDINLITTTLTGNNQSFINGYSNLQITIPTEEKAEAQKSATMSYYQLDNTKSNYSDENDVTITVANYNKNSISIKAVDSRGNNTKVTKTIENFVDYQDLTKGTLNLSRSDNGVGRFVTLSYDGTFWNGNFGQINNSLTASYKFKKSTDQSYTTGTTTINPTVDGNNFSFEGVIASDESDYGFNVDDVYEIIVEVSDKLETIQYQVILGAGSPAIAIYGNKASLGNKYDINLGGTQLWGDVYLNEGDIVNYSTEEVKTGKKWIDGKDIYRKIYKLEIINAETTTNIDISDLNFNEIIDVKGFEKSGQFPNIPIPFYNQKSNYIYVEGNRITCHIGWYANTVYIFLEYTKTTD